METICNYRSFVFYNIFGALIWAGGIPFLGYFLGSVVPGADRYLIPIVLGIIVLSSLPSLFAIFRDRERRDYVIAFFRARMQNPVVRKVVGVFLLLFGLVALVIPFFPFAWVGFFGLELLGLRVLLQEKVRSWRQKRYNTSHE